MSLDIYTATEPELWKQIAENVVAWGEVQGASVQPVPTDTEADPLMNMYRNIVVNLESILTV